MKKYTTHIKFIILFIAIVFLYSFASVRNSARKIKDINVQFVNGDNLFITYESVNKMLIQNYNDVKSQPKESIILNSLESGLQSNEMIEDVDVFVTVDGELCASLTQKTPIARVVDEGVAYYIDSKGSRMPLSSHYSARVPLVKGIKKKSDFLEAYKLAEFIYNDKFFKKQIIGIEQLKNNTYVLTTRLGNHRVIMGRLNSINAKFAKLKAFYQKKIKENTLDNYQTINLTFANQVVCTKK